MYLTAERLALANQEVKETFEQTSVAWQALPHWETGDPAQTQVRNDNLTAPDFTTIASLALDFELTLAEAVAPTPDSTLAKVIARTADLAAAVDDQVFLALRTGLPEVKLSNTKPEHILDKLIEGRASVEKAGYRSPSCLLVTTEGLQAVSQLVGGYSVKDSLLDAAHVNSLHRVDRFENPSADTRGIMIGRRQRIAHGGAADTSPGEEPVDLAVSVPPSVEVVGDTSANMIRLNVRISYAVRVKNPSGLVALLV